MVSSGKLRPPGKPNVFALPKGFLGVVAGWLMARVSKSHNAWAVSKLKLQPHDHVLEVGFGPGVGVQLIAERATQGFVVGVDPSPIMLRQARKRNTAAIKSGLVELCIGSVESLPCKDQRFDKVLSVNNVMLWPGPGQSLREVRRVMKPGGDLVIALNPRWAKTVQDVEDMDREIIDHIFSAGFPQAEMELRPDLKPAGAVTVLARAPNPN